MGDKEKRRSRRVDIALPVRVYGDQTVASDFGKEARTVNIGSGGAYLEWSDTESLPRTGDSLGLDIHMDPALTHKLSHLKVTAEAVVVRVEKAVREAEGAGVAVRFTGRPRLFLN